MFGVLAARGFAPARELDPQGTLTYRLRNCPYRAAVHENQPTMCMLHRGITLGLLDELGPDTTLTGFVPHDPDAAGCVIELRNGLADRRGPPHRRDEAQPGARVAVARSPQGAVRRPAAAPRDEHDGGRRASRVPRVLVRARQRALPDGGGGPAAGLRRSRRRLPPCGRAHVVRTALAHTGRAADLAADVAHRLDRSHARDDVEVVRRWR